MALRFVVPGTPVPKARPRRGAHGQTYTPRKTGAYEDAVRGIALGAQAKARWQLERVARYVLTIRLYLPDHRRADADNLAKAIADGLMPYAIRDDAQIEDWHITKRVDAEYPRAEIELLKKMETDE